MKTAGWTIVGEGPLADELRRAAEFVSATDATTLLIDPAPGHDDAIVVSARALESAHAQVIPLEAAFEAIEAVKATIASGEAGRVYGCFASVRVPRGSAPEDVLATGLFPALALALDTVTGEPVRVWARRMSLLAPDDAWFVTLRLRDETLITVEALASEPPEQREVLLEVTASERVLRAEPTRQAVQIVPFDGSPRTAPWWENLGERYLRLVNRRCETGEVAATDHRMARVWQACRKSADSGSPVTLA